METKTPNFHPPPLLMAARPVLRVRSPRQGLEGLGIAVWIEILKESGWEGKEVEQEGEDDGDDAANIFRGRFWLCTLCRQIRGYDELKTFDSEFINVDQAVFFNLILHTMTGEYRARLLKLAKWLVESALGPLRLFQERCEEEFLWESEMIKIRAADLKSKEVRVHTCLLSQQTKFNLLREESKGYAKLGVSESLRDFPLVSVTLLGQGCEESTQNASAATIGIIKSLIGHFDLDPNWVFDIVKAWLRDNKDFGVLCGILVICGLEARGHDTWRYPRLLPKDDEAVELYNSFSSKRLDEANKIGKINLVATGKDLMENEKQGDVTIDLFTAIDLESEAVIERASELENNQTLGLLTGFLSVNDRYHAHVLFDRLSPLNLAKHIQICNELFRLIEKSLSSAYELVWQTHLQNLVLPSASISDSMETNSYVKRFLVDLPKELFEMLSCAGPYLYRDALLLQKACYHLYGEWEKDDERIPMVLAARQTAKLNYLFLRID
ncbi:hypothetical protein RHSIM_Rhsim04G0125900 [Rhododendron simsii]|uniref:THO complex subunit 2 N-terminal domain-containing protein n=1 Tax=Rhododendron simsii TaxID=118357 RepID=A0A834H186_RHOSS|nr:hypothetical protein RHSIM_Rhsim04G0125900 [Rhododendron simsii]